MGWGGFLDKAISLFPRRKERWKNKIARLEREWARLLKEAPNAKKAARMAAIDADLARLHELLANASDA